MANWAPKALGTYVVMSLDFTALQNHENPAQLIPLLIYGGIYYLLVLGFSLYVLFAPEGTLNKPKKLEKEG